MGNNHKTLGGLGDSSRAEKWDETVKSEPRENPQRGEEVYHYTATKDGEISVGSGEISGVLFSHHNSPGRTHSSFAPLPDRLNHTLQVSDSLLPIRSGS